MSYHSSSSFGKYLLLAAVIILGVSDGMASDARTASGPPVITSPTSVSAVMGVAFSYQIAATEEPASFGATGLPSGLSVDVSSGVISGTPLVAGTSVVTIGASNAFGTGSASLTITVMMTPVITDPPVITSAPSVTATVGVGFTYQITATQQPTSFSASGIPSGLSIDVASGVISGVPLVAGTFVITLGATNIVGTGSASLSLTVLDTSSGGLQITSPLSAQTTVNTAFTYQIQSTPVATSFGAAGLPNGLSINPASGAITGIPNTIGNYSVSITASNGTATDTKVLSLVVTAAGGGGSSYGGSGSSTNSCGVGSGLSGLAAFSLFGLCLACRKSSTIHRRDS